MYRLFLDSSAVEHPAVNRRVVGSNPTRGVLFLKRMGSELSHTTRFVKYQSEKKTSSPTGQAFGTETRFLGSF